MCCSFESGLMNPGKSLPASKVILIRTRSVLFGKVTTRAFMPNYAVSLMRLESATTLCIERTIFSIFRITRHSKLAFLHHDSKKPKMQFGTPLHQIQRKAMQLTHLRLLAFFLTEMIALASCRK